MVGYSAMSNILFLAPLDENILLGPKAAGNLDFPNNLVYI